MQLTSLIVVLSSILAVLSSPTQASNATDIARLDLQQVARKHAPELDPLTVGAPLASNSTLEPRSLGGVFICTDVNWGGHCGHATQPLGVCIVLGSEWKNKISSFGPDECTRCVGYGLNDCTIILPDSADPRFVQEWLFDYPGDSTGGLGTIDPWNDRITSFKCSQWC